MLLRWLGALVGGLCIGYSIAIHFNILVFIIGFIIIIASIQDGCEREKESKAKEKARKEELDQIICWDLFIEGKRKK